MNRNGEDISTRADDDAPQGIVKGTITMIECKLTKKILSKE